MKSTELQLAEVDTHLKELDQKVTGLFSGQHNLDMKFEEASKRADLQIENLKAQLHELTKAVMLGRGEEYITGGSQSCPPIAATMGETEASSPRPKLQVESTRSDEINHFRGLIKLDFPVFNGDNPRGWIRKCQKYFYVNKMPDAEKIIYASMYMEGRADYWYLDYVEGKGVNDWGTFTEMVLERFGEDETVGSFNKLQQEGRVEEYMEKFEELMAFMLQMNGTLSEIFFVESFISGLKDEIKCMVKLLQPKTLMEAIQVARRQEKVLELQEKFQKLPKAATMGYKNYGGQGGECKLTDDKVLPIKKLSAAEIEERRRRGLCFNFDEKLSIGHKCKRLFMLMIGTEVESEKKEEVTETGEEAEDITVCQMSLRALAAQTSANTVRLQGKVNNQPISILMATGSAHTFLDEGTARKLQCVVEYIDPLRVAVADGKQILSSGKCWLDWSVEQHKFRAEVRVLDLGGCDLLIGADILRQFEPVTFHFSEQKITLTRGGLPLQLQGFKTER